MSRLRPNRRLLAVGLGLTLALTACGGDDPVDEDTDDLAAEDTFDGTDDDGAEDGTEEDDAATGDGGSITIAGLGFTEAQIMAELYAAVLEQAGFEVSIQNVENRELAVPALESGELDVVPEYLATATEFYNRDVNGPDADPVATGDVAETLAAFQELLEPRGLIALEAADAANQNAFAVTEDFADEHDLATLSDLGASGEAVVLAGPEECPDRPFCQIALEEEYGITVSELLPLGFGTIQVKDAVSSGQAQVGVTGTTDGTLGEFGLVLLDDDQNVQLADNLVPVVKVDSPAGTDAAMLALNALSAVLTTEDLAELNRRVDEDRELPDAVARDYLSEKGMI